MLVILHGWSDDARSFRRLGNRLVEEGVTEAVTHVLLGNYVSLDDDVTFADLAVAMERAWADANLPRAPRSVDMVVHSTGGLIVRDWMTRFSTPTTTPIRRLLMLAPANFGSPLAHKGRSFLGRIVKGYASDKPFETGAQVLRGLELASPYSWKLAQRDLFGSDTWYGPGRVLCSVLVGNRGYSGISAAANENGSDGTVRVSTANLNAAQLELDFSETPQAPVMSWSRGNGRTAFTRINAENHSTIAMKARGPRAESTITLIRRALQVEDDGFDSWCDELDELATAERTAGVRRSFTHGFQNTIVHLVDDLGAGIDDFFVEAFAKRWPRDDRAERSATRRLQDSIQTVHTNCADKSYRSLLFNVDHLERVFRGNDRPLYISVTAMPDLRRNVSVGYQTFGYDDIGSLRITPEQRQAVFQPDRTLLVTLRIKRCQGPGLFQFQALA